MEQNIGPLGQEAEPQESKSPEEINRTNSMDILLEESLELDFPKQGEIRRGVVASISETEILVSIGTKSEGIIPAREIERLSEENRRQLTVGQEIPVYVVNPEDPNGVAQLSYLRALEEQDWQRAEALLTSRETFEGKIAGYNKGGLIVPFGQLRGFVPSSQISQLRRAEVESAEDDQHWRAMVGESILLQVIEVDREKRRLIFSERAALKETRETLKERLLAEIAEGDVRVGRVTSLADFGAFVNIEGADGLVHLSEISWEHIDHPSQVLKIGQEVKVKVISIDHERKRIGLSIRQLQPDPWLKKVEHLREGQLVEGTITHLTKFGAFARLGEDLEGLIHISELSDQRIAHPKEVVHEGDVLTLRIIKIEPERHRIALSVRKVDSPAYADLDWKTTLAEVVEEVGEKATEAQANETPPPTSDEPGLAESGESSVPDASPEATEESPKPAQEG